MTSRVKKSKDVMLLYTKTEQKGLTKEQYKVTLPAQMVRKLGWMAKDKLKVWINRKKHIEVRKK